MKPLVGILMLNGCVAARPISRRLRCSRWGPRSERQRHCAEVSLAGCGAMATGKASSPAPGSRSSKGLSAEILNHVSRL